MAISERAITAKPGVAESRETGLLISDASCSPAVLEAYEQTFLSVRFALLSGTGSTILISAVDGSASAVALAANLAILAAREGEHVILADADPHTPTLDSVYAVSSGIGFTELVQVDDPALPAALQPASGLPNLRLLSAGNAGRVPGGIGRAKGLAEVMIRMKNQAERVILIGAPILTHVDSLDLCPHVDGVVITVMPGKTHRLDARRAREVLDRVHAPLLGVVLTRKAL